MGDEVFELIFHSPALGQTFIRLFRDQGHTISDLIAAGDASPELDEALIGWTEAEGQKEMDFFAGKEPPENDETITITLDQWMLEALEKWRAERSITLEQFIVAFLRFIVEPENEGWLKRFVHAEEGKRDRAYP